jgi:molybdopterin/thiamine biosynthesis adenylyltransferase
MPGSQVGRTGGEWCLMEQKASMERYRRQIPCIGEAGQERLSEATVFIAGAGGLGSPVALYLAAAGVGTLRIADRDVVERTNLNRQILHWDGDLGRRKVDSARVKLEALNPEISVETAAETIRAENLASLASGADVIVDAVDNFSTRYLLNRFALRAGVPLVHGAIRGFDGQATTIIPGRTGCLRCVFPAPPPEETAPVIGVTAGIIGLIQANEVIKYLLGRGELLENRLLVWNGLSGTLEEIPVGPDPGCGECGATGGERERER